MYQTKTDQFTKQEEIKQMSQQAKYSLPAETFTQQQQIQQQNPPFKSLDKSQQQILQASSKSFQPYQSNYKQTPSKLITSQDNPSTFQLEISDTLNRLKTQESHHQKILDALRSQVHSLKAQLELNKNLHERELQRIKETYNQQVIEIQHNTQKNSKTQSLQIENLKAQYYELQSLTNDLKEQLRQQTLYQQENFLQKTQQMENLSQKADFYKQQYLNVGKSEIQRLQYEIQELKKEYQSVIDNMKQQNIQITKDLQKKFDERSNIASDLHLKSEKLKQQRENLSEQFKTQLEEYQDEIRENQQIMEGYETDAQRLKRTLQDFKKENGLLVKEQKYIQIEIQRLRNEQDQLVKEKARLERLVYGRK